MIRVQQEPFDTAAELAGARAESGEAGATALFIGTVRGSSGDEPIETMTLEHYPGMTERALEEIEREAHARWPLHGSRIVHRYGRLTPGEDIVLVITVAAHRGDAFAACEFLMDWLKTQAPFWKLETGGTGERWVEARDSDDAAAARWSKEA